MEDKRTEKHESALNYRKAINKHR